LVPVIVTRNVPLPVEVQDIVEVPVVVVLLRITIAGVRLQVSPDGSGVSDRLIVPVKLPTAATVIVELPEVPLLTFMEIGLAVTLKSGGSVKVTITLCEIAPLVAVTVAASGFRDTELHDKIEVPEDPRVTLVRESPHARPAGAETARATVPVKPLTDATMIVEVPVEPDFTDTVVALAVTEKSPTWNDAMAEWDSGPNVPVTFTLLLPAVA
jgi:hypothetical protein